jgi:hypothetical protein
MSFSICCKEVQTLSAPWQYIQLFCQMVNWFTFFSMVRTLSNSLETTLTIVALFYWSITMKSKAQQNTNWMTSRQSALTVAAVSCVIRPTNGIIWIYMGVLHLFQARDRFQFLLAEVFPIGYTLHTPYNSGLALGLVINFVSSSGCLLAIWNFETPPPAQSMRGKSCLCKLQTRKTYLNSFIISIYRKTKLILETLGGAA